MYVRCVSTGLIVGRSTRSFKVSNKVSEAKSIILVVLCRGEGESRFGLSAELVRQIDGHPGGI